LPFFGNVLRDSFESDLSNYTLLDIGCGGGVLTEEFARFGCQVTGIDRSEKSIQVARVHSQNEGLDIDYQIGSALKLNFPDNSFEIVSCCDVLEHIQGWEVVITEIGRVLKPGGVFLFDTINRTPLSWLFIIFGLQEWSFTRLFPDGTHVWRMFITPGEINAECEKTGIRLANLSGGTLEGNPLSIIREVRKYKRGEIDVAQLGERLVLENENDLRLNYMGFGIAT